MTEEKILNDSAHLVLSRCPGMDPETADRARRTLDHLFARVREIESGERAEPWDWRGRNGR